MINESDIIFFGKDNSCIKYEYENCFYYLKHYIKYPNDITITIEIVYKNSLTRRKYCFFKRDIPKKHINILKEIIEYYESTIIMFRVIDEGYTYINVFEDLFN